MQAVEAWFRHRTDIEDRIRDAKHGAALRHLPSGDKAVNTAWMWGALLAVNLSAWLHELGGLDHGNGYGRAHLSRLRRELICIPGRVIRHSRRITLRLPVGDTILAEVLARLRALPALESAAAKFAVHQTCRSPFKPAEGVKPAGRTSR